MRQWTAKRNRPALIAAGVLIVALVVVVAVITSRPPPARTNSPAQVMTIDPVIIANLTSLPDAPPLSGSAAAPFVELGQMIDQCRDYDDTRRGQVKQHLSWILNPASIPPGPVAIALGPNPQGRLIFGMSTFTANQWRLGGQQPGSCLVTIGKRLNQLLVDAGEKPMSIFETAE